MDYAKNTPPLSNRPWYTNIIIFLLVCAILLRLLWFVFIDLGLNKYMTLVVTPVKLTFCCRSSKLFGMYRCCAKFRWNSVQASLFESSTGEALDSGFHGTLTLYTEVTYGDLLGSIGTVIEWRGVGTTFFQCDDLTGSITELTAGNGW